MLGRGLDFLFGGGACLLPKFRQNARTQADSQHIQNQSDPAVPHDGGTGINSKSLQLLTYRFHDNFLRVVDAVHHQTELPVFRLQHHQAHRVGRVRRLQPEHPVQIRDGKQASPAAVNRRSVDLFNLFFRGVPFDPD